MIIHSWFTKAIIELMLMGKNLKINIARFAIFLLCWGVLFGAATIARAQGSNASDQDRALSAREAGAAGLPALRGMVESRIGGTVVGVSTAGSGNSLRYQFKVLRGADLVAVTVNAKSGAITKIKEPRK